MPIAYRPDCRFRILGCANPAAFWWMRGKAADRAVRSLPLGAVTAAGAMGHLRCCRNRQANCILLG